MTGATCVLVTIIPPKSCRRIGLLTPVKRSWLMICTSASREGNVLTGAVAFFPIAGVSVCHDFDAIGEEQTALIEDTSSTAMRAGRGE